jgi:hypothetical protein
VKNILTIENLETDPLVQALVRRLAEECIPSITSGERTVRRNDNRYQDNTIGRPENQLS